MSGKRFRASQPLRAPADTGGMSATTLVLILTEAGRLRWQGAADLQGVELEQLVRAAVEAAIRAREKPLTRWAPA